MQTARPARNVDKRRGKPSDKFWREKRRNTETETLTEPTETGEEERERCYCKKNEN